MPIIESEKSMKDCKDSVNQGKIKICSITVQLLWQKLLTLSICRDRPRTVLLTNACFLD